MLDRLSVFAPDVDDLECNRIDSDPFHQRVDDGTTERRIGSVDGRSRPGNQRGLGSTD